MAEQHEEEVHISCTIVTKLPAELRVPPAPIVSPPFNAPMLPLVGGARSVQRLLCLAVLLESGAL